MASFERSYLDACPTHTPHLQGQGLTWFPGGRLPTTFGLPERSFGDSCAHYT